MGERFKSLPLCPKLSMIKHGYHLPFKRKPSPFIAKNNASSLRHKDFVEDSIKELLVNRCIEQVDTASYCCNPLTVAEGEKLRLVLDLRHVNECLEVEKFKYENLKTVAHLFEEGYYFGTFDLNQSYGTTKYFQFWVLPFGLASACYAFTKLIRPLVKKWRGAGIRCVVYLDAEISAIRSLKICQKHHTKYKMIYWPPA